MSRNVADLRRRSPRALPQRRFYLFCEGKNTEPNYFHALARYVNNAQIKIIALGGVGVPKTIAINAIEKAKELGLIGRRRKKLDSFEAADEVWAVFDRDEHPCFDEAISLCSINGISVARSNPCFEVWLILHCDDYDRDEHRHITQRRLRELRPEYDPTSGKSVDCETLIRFVDQAERRADIQLARRREEGNEMAAPSTTVNILTAGIRAASILSSTRRSL